MRQRKFDLPEIYLLFKSRLTNYFIFEYLIILCFIPRNVILIMFNINTAAETYSELDIGIILETKLNYFV